MKAPAVLLIGAAAFLAGRVTAPSPTLPAASAPVIEVVRDTVVISRPQIIRTVELRTIEVAAARADSTGDTAAVLLPVETRLYEGPDYRAWVSGWNPTLDSLAIIRPTTFITRTAPAASSTRRFNFGIQAGIGMTPKGLQPYLGIGVGYTF